VIRHPSLIPAFKLRPRNNIYIRSGGIVNVRDKKEFGLGWQDWISLLGYKPQCMLLGPVMPYNPLLWNIKVTPSIIPGAIKNASSTVVCTLVAVNSLSGSFGGREEVAMGRVCSRGVAPLQIYIIMLHFALCASNYHAESEPLL
jgi:hypothetical protein